MNQRILGLCLLALAGCAVRPHDELDLPSATTSMAGRVGVAAKDAGAAAQDHMVTGGTAAAQPAGAGRVSPPPVAAPSSAGAPAAAGSSATAAGHASMVEDDAGTPAQEPGARIEQLDLLFVVDNTNSMFGEQQSLQAVLPKFIKALTTGVGGSSQQQFPPVRDVHIGVVSADMGTPAIDFNNCRADGGDDGRLQHAAHGSGCDASYPLFLSYGPDTDAARAQLEQDFSCIAALGTGGCGFEQTLESAFKALWPSVYEDASGKVVQPNPFSFLSTTPEGMRGRGDVPEAQGGNLGFLRNGPQSPSLIAIVVLTDEDDCSMSDSHPLSPNNQLPEDDPIRMQDMNLRCYYNKDKLYSITNRYLNGLHELRPNDPRRVVFAAITGVPADLVDAPARAGIDFSQANARGAFYDRILNDPRMQEVIDPSTGPGSGQGNLKPSCLRVDATGQPSTAFPPRRIVELARGFGAQGMVQSICQDDFTSAADAVVELIARQLAR